ncbi:MAG: alpha-2-macroglobulin family protein [Trueperaceae bacterium]|nr:MAG: alpha-2-macroglobulin family protein [Trueperaceae bacterium]
MGASSRLPSLPTGTLARRRSHTAGATVRRLWRLTLAALAVAGAPLVALAQDAPIPERFATTRSATDYPGGDLTPIFDVSLERCHATCLRLDQCLVFTFDMRNGACFPKGAVGEPVAFEGALSGVITVHGEDVLERAREARSTLDFITDDDLAAAREQARTMAERYQADGLSEAALLANARTQPRAQAIRWTGAAVTVADGGAAWLAHARALADEAERNRNERFELHRQAARAALNASLRLGERERAEALVVMALSLEVGFRGDTALAALRLADQLRPGIAPDDLARLRERFGFRVLAHDVDASGAAPRICVSLSEALATTRDYAPFVVVDAPGTALEVEGQQLCVAGVAYGERYRLTLRAGLPGASGDALMADVPLDVYVRDRDPSVRFPGRGYVLPVSGPRALPVETVNADQLDLRLLRVSDRNLVAAIREGQFAQALGFWEGERFESLLAEPVWEGTARLEGQLNRTTASRLPLDEAGPLEPGVYVLRASVPGAEPFTTPPATQWFMVSDLGVTALSGSDGLHVVVQRLSDGQGVAGLRVALLARSNRVLAEAVSDDQGHVRFGAALTLGTGAAAPVMVIVEGDDDMAVLSLDDAEFDLSDRGVAGRPVPGPIDVYLTTDRGAYRPSDVIHVTALARDTSARAIPGLPLSARLLRPDGVEYSRSLSEHERAGGHVFSLPLGGDVPRGIWRVDVLADPDAPALASLTVLVEDFVPERIDVELSLADGPIDLAAPPDLFVEVRHGFGPPAAGLPLSGSVSVYTTDELEGWPRYRFGRFDERVDTQRHAFAPGFVSDVDGRLVAPLPLDRVTLEPRPYALDVRATIVDGASRPVERSLTRALRPTAPVVGIRPGFDDDLPEDAEATFDLVLVGPDGALMPGDLRWQVDRVQTRYQWFSLDGSWYWEPVSDRQRVADGVASVTGGPARIAVPVTWGRHELRVTREGAAFASASVPFSAGWFAADTTRETPDLLDVSLDATEYAPGDTARLRIVPEHAGVALVTVLSDRVVAMRLVAVEGETTVELPVTDEWGTGVYVSASLIRPSDGPEHLSSRSLGLAHAVVPPGERALEALLRVPDETRSRERLDVVLELPGGVDGTAYATVAAVDLGVLTLTGFAAPDPLGHLFGQRRLGVAIRDLYGRLIDARHGAMGQVRSGGGLDADSAMSDGPVPAEDLLAFFAGPVELTNGRAEFSFDLPAFAGTVRVMAVVWTDRAVGQAQADVLVRDPVVVQPSLPRFMTPGDSSRLRLELTHVTGPAGEMALTVEGHGLGATPPSVVLDEGGRAVLDLPLQPTAVGDHELRITLTTPDGHELTREVRLSVRHTDPVSARTSRVVLAPGEHFRFDDAALAGFRAGTARATLVAGAGAALDLPGLIQRLLTYPYGCTEQIASGLQPLLLAPEVVVDMGLMSEAELNELVQVAIDRILTRQRRDGGFGLWGTDWYDPWLDAYVTDVLLRAEAQGANVPETALRMALDNLRNRVAQAGSMYDGATAYAYAFYVLARAGEAAIGDLRYYADTQAERFDTPLSAAQLGAALAAYGERERADAMFARARDLARASDAPGGWRSDYGTALRDQAGVLALAIEAGSAAVDRVQFATLITRRGPVHHLSTQEAVWALQAAVALGAESQGLTLDGRPVTGNVVHLFDGAPVVVGNGGSADVPLTLTVFGVPVDAPEPGGVGYTIRRSHYTIDGAAADLSDVRVGDRLVTVLEVRPDRGVAGGRLLIDDPLPAGFEIDNANLLREGDVRALDWLAVHDSAAATEARAERFIAAVDWTSETPLRLAYVVRAVSPGEFHHAAAAVEDMYRPTERALGATGRVTVRP